MRKVLLIAEVSLLAEDIEFEAYHGKYRMVPISLKTKGPRGGWLYNEYDMQKDSGDLENSLSNDDSDFYDIEDSSIRDRRNSGDSNNKEDERNMKRTTRRRLNWSPFRTSKTKKEIKQMLTSSQREEMCKILGSWEPPEMTTNNLVRIFSIILSLQENTM